MTPGKTLCLNMIVKNETANLERCLRAVADHISCWVIGDTGSTDGTQDFIRSFFAARNLPGELHSFPFETWEQARNAALDCAYASPLSFDYLLFADADMELAVDDRTFREKLSAPGYRLIQRAQSGLTYWNVRLASRVAGARYQGVTHEYLDVPGGVEELRGVWYRDHASGSNRVIKFERDIRLLTEALKSEPDNHRYWFYLAQSYRDAGQTAKAAEAYAKRAGMGGWDEEAWNARLQEARCLRSLGDEGGFLRQALAAFNQRPHRAEPLYDLARFYREKGMNDASLLFSEAGLTLRRPDEDILFIEDFVYAAGIREEFSIAANYARDPALKDRGFAACDWLALSRSAPEAQRNLALSNLHFYMESAAKIMPSFAPRQIGFVPPDGYVATNPSVTRQGDEIVLVQRTVNYAIDPAFPEGDDRRFATRDGAPIHTRNFLLRLDGDLAVRSSGEILPPEDKPEPVWNFIQGFEDMRPFAWRGELWCISCVREMSPEGWCELTLARIDERAPGGCRLAGWRMLRPEGERQHEKNWMPLVEADALRFVYLCDPTRIVDDQARRVAETVPPIHAVMFRGGSQLVAFDGGWLALVHEARVREGQRVYRHRLVWFDPELRLKGVSRPFFFHGHGVEFAAGLAWHPDGKRLMISYGVEDSQAWIATVDAEDVRRVLEDVERLPSGMAGARVGAPLRRIGSSAPPRRGSAADAQSLASIFRHWGTDKVTNGYADLYECLFQRDRDRVESVLEIGIGTMLPGVHSSMVGFASPGYRPGGSLRSWRDFFPNATIYGLDVQPDTQFSDEERIVTMLCDSTERSQVDRLLERLDGKQFDIVLDDGSHRLDDQIATLRNLYPFVKEGRTYIVEDVVNGALVHHQDKIKAVCGEDPFFFHGERNNPLVIMKRPRARPEDGPGAAPRSCGARVNERRRHSFSVSCVENREHMLEKAADAVEQTIQCKHVDYVYWFSSKPYPRKLANTEVINISIRDSFDNFADDINSICLKVLPHVVTTDFNIVVQPDGFAVNADAWDEDFLKYDYVGAPWPWMWGGGPPWRGPIVGNGGFSLRSRRLYEALRSIDTKWKIDEWSFDERLKLREYHGITPGGEKFLPEDILICLWYRDELERKFGIKFCPPELASKFSVETVCQYSKDWLGRSFGFHGVAAAPYYGVNLTPSHCRETRSDEVLEPIQKQVNSFDVFDTLIARRYGSARPIFEQIGLEFKLSSFVVDRIAADTGVRSLAEIYRFLGLGEHIMAREIELEHEHAFPIQENLDRVENGDLLISDMYLPACDILSIVRSVGLDKQVTVYQSNGDKRSGDVWRRFAANKPARHVGDDRQSDFEVPRRFGVSCELYEKSQLTAEERSIEEIGLCDLAYLMREVRLRAGRQTYPQLSSVACQFNLPWLFLFAEQIRRKSSSPKVFLGRDCQLLYFIYRSYFDHCYYLPFSRKVAHRQPAEALRYFIEQIPENAVLIDLCSTGATWQKLQAPLDVIVALYVDGFHYTKEKPILPERFSYLAKSSECGHTSSMIELINCADHGHLREVAIYDDGLMRADYAQSVELDGELIKSIQLPIKIAVGLSRFYKAGIRPHLETMENDSLRNSFLHLVGKINRLADLEASIPRRYENERAYLAEVQRGIDEMPVNQPGSRAVASMIEEGAIEGGFFSSIPFLQFVDSPAERREATRAFDMRLAHLLNQSDSCLPQIHCFYEVMSDAADHRALIAAMKSMRAAGHPVRLWSYTPEKLEFLAASGVDVRQAADVVPRGLYDRIVGGSEIRYFSDVFRYAVLYEHGGLWMDADMILLRPFPYRGGHFLNLQWRGSHKGHFICGNVMGAPPFSRHMRALYEASIERFFAGAGWEFGLIGPKLLSDYVASEAGAELRDRLFSPMLFNAIDWTEIDRFDKPVSELADYLNDDRLFGIHLWTARNAAKSGGEGAPLISMLTEPGGLPNFTDLADRFNTDKNRHTGNRHCYARIYDRLLSSRRFSMRRLMEIGLCRGLAERNQTETPSVTLWQTFFPFAQIIGVDLTDFSALNNDRFKSFVCDQSKIDDLRKVATALEPGSLDVIIDDGSHASFDEQLTLREFFPLLADGGWFFIEDLDWQPPGEDPSKITLTKTLLREIRDSGAPRSIDPLGIAELAPQFAEILFFDSHYELTRARLMGGLVAIRKGRKGSAVSA